MNDPTLIVRALHALAHLLAVGRVIITNLWTDSGSGPGLTSERMVVRVDVTGNPIERDAIVAALTGNVGPEEWTGDHGVYREWKGSLLTMDLIVSTRLSAGPIAAATTPHVAEPPPVPAGPPTVAEPPAPARVTGTGPAHLAGRVSAWTRGTAGGREAARTAAPLTVPDQEEVDHRPLLDLLVDERYGDLRSHVIEVHGEPGQTTGDLAAKYRGAPGVVVVPGRPDIDDPALVSAWKDYAVARAMHELGSPACPTYPTLADALTAVNLWPGRDMLEHDWAVEVAQQLVDPSAADVDRDPATATAAHGRLRRMLPAGLRGLGGQAVVR